jgi:hypothetical protein
MATSKDDSVGIMLLIFAETFPIDRRFSEDCYSNLVTKFPFGEYLKFSQLISAVLSLVPAKTSTAL